ncbi:DUF805 domain-containing protein [Citrobacter arsenatis]|uniref:DUF805 domain-containing protein n=1 Tax=Citrobacter arsenatis TaxID=2546350 RepID=UPI00300E39D1
MNWYLAVLKKYAIFSGRACRKEFWMFMLFSFIVSIILNFITIVCGLSLSLSMLYSMSVMLPGLSVLIRRLHDTGRSGSYAFLLFTPPLVGAIVLLVFACKKGTEGDNMYGADPLQSPDANLQGQ